MKEKVAKHIKGKTILVTGGTGSFGHAVADQLLALNPAGIIIFSRDEKKQFDMGNRYNSDKLRFVVGDVRDQATVEDVMRGVNLVFHAAALKQVPNCEFFPVEAVRTNILGSANVISAAVRQGVERVVVLSTDKAVYPINVMGMTKALMERVMIAAARDERNGTVLCGTRYGNVMYTRGSVIPYFVQLMKEGKSLKVTDRRMTRFMMSLHESLDLVLYALTHGHHGEIYVRKAPAATIDDLAWCMKDIFTYDGAIEDIGIRPGEKMHETLVSTEEILRTEDCGDYFKIIPEAPRADYREYYFSGKKVDNLPPEGYTSANTRRLTREELKSLLLAQDEIQRELAGWKAGT